VLRPENKRSKLAGSCPLQLLKITAAPLRASQREKVEVHRFRHALET